MKATLYPASERGHVNMGWLNSHHSFSFGHWQNPEKVHFGALRVLNDDVVKGGGGFGAHPHDNMEIVSIPLTGALKHKDSTGTDGVINTGDVQIMSAGSGITHSEMNVSPSADTNFLQVWVFPKKRNIAPRYDQKTFDAKERNNQWQIVVSADEKDGGVWINQDAVFSLTNLQAGKELEYTNKFKQNGVYLFVLEGNVEAASQQLGERDAIGIAEADSFIVKAKTDTKILAIEIPLVF